MTDETRSAALCPDCGNEPTECICVRVLRSPTAPKLDIISAANAKINAAFDVLDGAAITFEDDRVGYVEIQVDREAWLRWEALNV